MLTSISIEGFETIKKGSLKEVSQINVITGKNNRGKSSFLQSLYLLNNNKDPKLIPNLDKNEMFWDYEPKIIKYVFEFEKKQFKVKYSPNIPFPNAKVLFDLEEYLSPNSPYFNYIQQGYCYVSSGSQYLFKENGEMLGISQQIKQDMNEKFLNFADFFNSSLLLNHTNFLAPSQEISTLLDLLQNKRHKEDEFLEILSTAYETKLSKLRHSPHEFKGWSVYLDDGKESRATSIDDLGDGARTAINILLRIFTQNPKLILIDEIEMHQHYKALEKLCAALLNYAKLNNVQVFISTHSLEAIKILSELSKKLELGLMVHHFLLDEGKLDVRTIPSLDAEVVMDLKGDIRSIDEYA
jgi:predicted ATPase